MDKSDLILAAIERLYAKVVVIETDLSDVKTDVSGLKADVSGLKTGFDGMKVRMDRMEAEQKTMREVVGSNHHQVVGRIKQLSELIERHIRHPV
jgi:hypothetical protein